MYYVNITHYTHLSKAKGLTLAFARSLLTKQSKEIVFNKNSSEGDDIGAALILNVANDTTTIVNVIYIINFIFSNKKLRDKK